MKTLYLTREEFVVKLGISTRTLRRIILKNNLSIPSGRLSVASQKIILNFVKRGKIEEQTS
jgi:hypothetical protein